MATKFGAAQTIPLKLAALKARVGLLVPPILPVL